MLFDHYVFANVKSNFVYKTLSDTVVYGIDHGYIHRVVFRNPRFKPQLVYLKQFALIKYKRLVYDDAQKARQGHLESVNKRDHQRTMTFKADLTKAIPDVMPQMRFFDQMKF